MATQMRGARRGSSFPAVEVFQCFVNKQLIEQRSCSPIFFQQQLQYYAVKMEPRGIINNKNSEGHKTDPWGTSQERGKTRTVHQVVGVTPFCQITSEPFEGRACDAHRRYKS